MDAVSKECSICLGPYEATDWKKLSCNHEFHTGCITNWEKKSLQIGPSCPICRKAFDTAMEAAEQFSIWYEKQKNKELGQRVILQIATSAACGIAVYKITRFALSYFTSSNPIGALACKMAPIFLGFFSFRAVIEVFQVRHESRKEQEEQNPDKIIEEAINRYNVSRGADLEVTVYRTYYSYKNLTIEKQINIILETFYNHFIDLKKYPGIHNCADLFCEADLMSMTRLAKAIEVQKLTKDQLIKTCLLFLQAQHLEAYQKLTDLGVKLCQEDRYEDSKTAIYETMQQVLIQVIRTTYATVNQNQSDPVTNMRIAIINALEEAKSKYPQRDDIKQAISVVQAEYKEAGELFIQQLFDDFTQSEDPDVQPLTFDQISLVDLVMDPQILDKLISKVLRACPSLSFIIKIMEDDAS